jgi:hypothetical protein
VPWERRRSAKPGRGSRKSWSMPSGTGPGSRSWSLSTKAATPRHRSQKKSTSSGDRAEPPAADAGGRFDRDRRRTAAGQSNPVHVPISPRQYLYGRGVRTSALPLRQNIAGAILNSGIAEILAGFHAGKLAEPRAHEYWDWYNLDERGQDDADALTHRFLRDIREIEDESLARAADSGEETTSRVLELFFFERTRKAGDRPHRFVIDRASAMPRPPISAKPHVVPRNFGWGTSLPVVVRNYT